MDRGTHWLALCLALLAAGCGDDVPLGSLGGDAGPDGALDASRGDAGARDAGPPDAGPPDAGPPRPVGAGCEGDTECLGPDAVCLEAVVELAAGPIRVDFSTGGYCTRPCDDAGRTCPTGSICSPDDVPQRYCIDECASDADCRAAEGYRCLDVGLASDVCVPPLMT